LIDSVSCSRFLYAGTPQGIRSGPNGFKLLINDLSFSVNYVKYIDDVTASSVSVKPDEPALQSAADQLSFWCKENGMRPNIKKTREMLIHVGKKLNRESVPQLVIDEEKIEQVNTFKLLGIMISFDLSSGPHVSYMLYKTSIRYFIIYQLTKIGIPHHEIVIIYCAIICSVLEYACTVWH
jgi:Reverse transcriptase (RNA-dependent DNA polymerase)